MKQVIKKDYVRVSAAGDEDGAARKASARASRAHAARGPGVHLVRVEGRVHAIEVTCRCGETAVLAIDYDDTTQAPAQAPAQAPTRAMETTS